MQVILGLGGSMPVTEALDPGWEARLGSMLAAVHASLRERGFVCTGLSGVYHSAGWQFPRADRGPGKVVSAVDIQFWNMVWTLTIPPDWHARPEVFYRELQAIEAAFGRDRAQERFWGARPLDIDILDYGGQVFLTEPVTALSKGETNQTARPGLIIPHIFLDARLFVLLPLQEIRPDWIHPVSGLSVDQLIAQCEHNPLLPPDRPVRVGMKLPILP